MHGVIVASSFLLLGAQVPESESNEEKVRLWLFCEVSVSVCHGMLYHVLVMSSNVLYDMMSDSERVIG